MASSGRHTSALPLLPVALLAPVGGATQPLSRQPWLGDFYESLSRFTRCTQLRERAAIRHGDTFASSGMVCALSFDRDARYFASAGVCRRIKVFDCEVLGQRGGGRPEGGIHYPAVEMAGQSKLSSVCWSPYSRNILASTDYRGAVQVWDAFTQQTVLEYSEHKRRAWSVHFSRLEPTRLASGSDDGHVRLWSLDQARSTGCIKAKANVCSVQFAPYSPNILVFGSADYKVSCYDLRRTKTPLCVLAGHGRAVSYVAFCATRSASATNPSEQRVVSASTDNTLRLWDLSRAVSCASAYSSVPAGPSSSFCLATFSGHTNEKNFVGLSVADEGYIACGSENNSVYVYHKGFPVPMTSHRFQAVDPLSGNLTDDDAGQFVSSVCWRQGTNTLVAGNSLGNVKILDLM